MRWLIHSDRDDGVATIFLVLAMTSMLVGAGFAIDVGQYVVHARSAQNSADATALAVATDCALAGAPIADYSQYRKTGQTITAPACGDHEATIAVTKDVEGLFLRQNAGAVKRTATAKWGTLSGANTPTRITRSARRSAGPAAASSSQTTRPTILILNLTRTSSKPISTTLIGAVPELGLFLSILAANENARFFERRGKA